MIDRRVINYRTGAAKRDWQVIYNQPFTQSRRRLRSLATLYNQLKHNKLPNTAGEGITAETVLGGDTKKGATAKGDSCYITKKTKSTHTCNCLGFTERPVKD